MRAFYRGYSAATGRRAGQVRRLHVMREDGKFPGRQGLCGTAGWGVTQSPAVIIDPLPAAPPDGLTWCRACVGHAAALLGQLDSFARILAALNDLAERRCARCRQHQANYYEFSYSPVGRVDILTVQLCARCHSLSALEDDDHQLDPSVFADQPASPFTAAGAR